MKRTSLVLCSVCYGPILPGHEAKTTNPFERLLRTDPPAQYSTQSSTTQIHVEARHPGPARSPLLRFPASLALLRLSTSLFFLGKGSPEAGEDRDRGHSTPRDAVGLLMVTPAGTTLSHVPTWPARAPESEASMTDSTHSRVPSFALPAMLR